MTRFVWIIEPWNVFEVAWQILSWFLTVFICISDSRSFVISLIFSVVYRSKIVRKYPRNVETSWIGDVVEDSEGLFLIEIAELNILSNGWIKKSFPPRTRAYHVIKQSLSKYFNQKLAIAQWPILVRFYNLLNSWRAKFRCASLDMKFKHRNLESKNSH